MAALILPSRRAVQPQGPVEVDWGNPLTLGLGGLFDTRAGLELVHKNRATNLTNTIVASRSGVAADYSGTANQQYAHRESYATTGAMTIFALVEVRSLTDYTAIIAKQQTTTRNAPYELRLGSGPTDSRIDFIRASTGAVTEAVGPSNTLSAAIGRPRAIAVTAPDGVLGSLRTGYVDGLESTLTPAVTAQTASDTQSPVWIGRRFDGATQLDGRIYFVGVWGRQFSANEVRALTDNPWQLFRPIQRRIWVPVAGGGGDVTGSLNATEAGSDTLASSGNVLVSGALSATESGPDTFSSAGAVVVSGSLAVTESGPDTFSATGTTTGGVSGSLDATEAGSDTATVSGVVLVAGSLAVTESGPDTFAASGAVVVTGLLSATESGPDTFAAVGVTASVNGSLNATEQGSDTAEIRSSEQAGEGRGFVMVDRPSALWWKRKPKALSDEVAEQKVERVVRVIKEIAGKQQTEQTAKQAQREVAQAIAPMLADMPGFDWTPLYRTIVAEFERQREEAARIEAVAQIARIRALEQDDEDVMILLMSF